MIARGDPPSDGTMLKRAKARSRSQPAVVQIVSVWRERETSDLPVLAVNDHRIAAGGELAHEHSVLARIIGDVGRAICRPLKSWPWLELHPSTSPV